jgi:EmrB/QacA subfamily drug resistance transporter
MTLIQPMKGLSMATTTGIDRNALPDESPTNPSGRAPLLKSREPNKWLTLTAVCLGTFMLLLDVTIVNVALPSIQTSLHASFSDLQWVVDAYALALAACLLTAGAFADMYGRKLVYVAGLAIFTVASMLCGFAESHLFLEISRAAQGVGGAIMFSVSLALLADAFRGKDRGVAFGIWGAITGVAVAVGPLLGGALTSGLSWRWIFFVNLPVGIVALLITVLGVSESKAPQARRPDWIGAITFTAALALLVYGLVESGERGFSDDRVLGCFAATAVLLIAFIAAERFGNHPMFDLALFRLPTFSGGLVAAFGVSSSIFAMLLYLVLYLQDTLAYSPLQTGLRLLIISGGVLLTSTVAGRLTEHISVRWLIGPGLLLVGTGLLLMRGLSADSSWTHLIAGFIVAGVGVGMINPPLASTAVGVVSPQRAGMASGINSTFRQIGIATGIALLGTLFANRERSQIMSRLALVPGAHSHTSAVTAALKTGQISHALATLPPSLRGPVGIAARGAFTNSLDLILLVSAVIAFSCGVIAMITIRPKDFLDRTES